MTVEQWLADLEEKAKAATPGPWEMKKDCDESDHMQVRDSAGVVCETPLWGFEYPEQWENGRFIATANPAAVLRLVAMVRWLANRLKNTSINQCCFCSDGIKQHTVKCECTKTWCEVACEAVEKETCPKN